MTRRTKKWGVSLPAVLALLSAGITLFDWNLLKNYTEARVQAATGRQLNIGGNLDVDLGWHPRVRMERVSFATTEWGSEPIMFRADVAIQIVDDRGDTLGIAPCICSNTLAKGVRVPPRTVPFFC